MCEKITKTVLIRNRAGLHARPLADLSRAARKFKCDIHLHVKDYYVNAKSMLSLVTLTGERYVPYGTEIKLVTEGEGAAEAILVLAEILERKYG